MNTESSAGGRLVPKSLNGAFYRSMEEILPIIERWGLDLLDDPHLTSS